MATKKTSRATKKTAGARKRQMVGESIIEGLKEAIAWTRGKNSDVRITLVQVPQDLEVSISHRLPEPLRKDWSRGTSNAPNVFMPRFRLVLS